MGTTILFAFLHYVDVTNPHVRSYSFSFDSIG